jgi:hypothetical protein
MEATVGGGEREKKRMRKERKNKKQNEGREG